jgi:hypothetical protein
MNVDLTHAYQRKSDVELILIATDDGSNYTSDAKDAASTILLSRHPAKWSVQAVRDEFFSRLNDLANKCSICQCPEVTENIRFELCTIGTMDETGSLAGMGSLLVLGVGFIQTKRSSIPLELKLCAKCAGERTLKTWKGTRLRITEDDCLSHPFYEFYKAQGYCDVRLCRI